MKFKDLSAAQQAAVLFLGPHPEKRNRKQRVMHSTLIALEKRRIAVFGPLSPGQQSVWHLTLLGHELEGEGLRK